MTDNNDHKTELPAGWVECTLPEFCELVMGQSPPSSTYNTNKVGLPFYQGKTEFGELYPTPRKYCDSPVKIAQKGDVLISVRAPVGPTNIAPHKACIGRGLTAIRPMATIPTKFILYLFRNHEPTISKQGTGTTFKAITKDFLERLSFPLPPLAEQHRIVAKIEELFSDLDHSVAALETAQAQLKIYRQAVLKYAFEGKLTEQWRAARAQNPKGFQNLLGLMGLIQNAIKKKKIDKGDYFPDINLEETPHTIPDQWVWLPWKTIVMPEKYSMKRGPFGSALKKAFFVPAGYKVYEQGNAINDDPYRGIYYITEEKYKELKAFRVEAGDLIISCSGVTLGRIMEIPDDFEPGIINQALLKITLNPEIMDKRFFILMFRSQIFQNRIFQKALGTAMPNMVGMKELKELIIPIPSLPEQHAIVEEIEARLSIVDNLEATIDTSLQQAGALRQSILKQAFAGKLVAQDANDEPASVLLERIKNNKP